MQTQLNTSPAQHLSTTSRDVILNQLNNHPSKNLRARDLARALNISEAALLDAQTNQGVWPLRPEPLAIIQALTSLGDVMALTRNEHAVIEKDGQYSGLDLGPHMGQVVSDGIDLRLFFRNWRYAFAAETQTKRGTTRSIQFFDLHGDAIHKVYLRDTSNINAFQSLVEQLTAPLPPVSPLPHPAPIPERPDAEIDVDGLRSAWMAMRNTHEFFGITRRFQVSRLQALRLAPPQMVEPLNPVLALKKTLTDAASQSLPIMVFVGNPNCIQIHTGPIQRIVETGPWLNIMDPGFNLHIQTPGIANAFVVQKPTEDGIVSSLELYDHDGESIALLFGERKPGRAERDAWRQVLSELPRLGANQ